MLHAVPVMRVHEISPTEQIKFYDFKFLPYIPHSYLLGKRNKQHSLSPVLKRAKTHKKLKFYKLYRRQSISYPPIISVDLRARGILCVGKDENSE